MLLGEPSSTEYMSLFELFHGHYLPHITLIGAGQTAGSTNASLGGTLNVDGAFFRVLRLFIRKTSDSYVMSKNETIKVLAREHAGQVSECAEKFSSRFNMQTCALLLRDGAVQTRLESGANAEKLKTVLKLH